MTFFLTSKMEQFGLKKGALVAAIGQLLVFVYLRMFFPTEVIQIVVTTLLSSIFNTWLYMITMIFIYDFPINRYTGVFLTFLASFNNLGMNTAPHTKILDHISWWVMSWVGIVVQVFIIILVQLWMFDWKEKG